MTYLAVISAVLLGQLPADERYFKGNSLHGADPLFPPELAPGAVINHKIIARTDADWHDWYESILNASILPSPRIIKDSWINYPNWHERLPNASSLVVISDCSKPLDFIYCYLNAVQKIPLHMHRRLMNYSPLHPKLWNNLNKTARIRALGLALQHYPRDAKINDDFSVMRVDTVEILSSDFPDRLASFYLAQGFKINLDHETKQLHNEFVRRQQENYKLAKAIVGGHRAARGPHDEMLFHYLDHSGAIGS